MARIQVGGKRYLIGTYTAPEDAAKAYDEVARKVGRPVNFTTYERVSS